MLISLINVISLYINKLIYIIFLKHNKNEYYNAHYNQ